MAHPWPRLVDTALDVQGSTHNGRTNRGLGCPCGTCTPLHGDSSQVAWSSIGGIERVWWDEGGSGQKPCASLAFGGVPDEPVQAVRCGAMRVGELKGHPR